jgi:hypothetical protein
MKEAMDAVEKRTMSLRNLSKHWNIPLISLFHHLYGKTKSKKLVVPITNTTMFQIISRTPMKYASK